MILHIRRIMYGLGGPAGQRGFIHRAEPIAHSPPFFFFSFLSFSPSSCVPRSSRASSIRLQEIEDYLLNNG